MAEHKDADVAWGVYHRMKAGGFTDKEFAHNSPGMWRLIEKKLAGMTDAEKTAEVAKFEPPMVAQELSHADFSKLVPGDCQVYKFDNHVVQQQN
jgi:hypothetical protein